MNATEILRHMLDERGVEWDADDEVMDDGSLSQVTYWYCNGIEWSADGRDEYLAFDAVQLITPEQAIAATLESDGEYERKMDSLLCLLTNGLYSKTRAYSLDFMESCVEEAFEAGNARQTSTTHAVIVSDESTDCATGHCECELCGQSIDPWDRFCRHCGAKVVTDG